MQLRTNILHYPLPGVLLSGIADCSQKNVPFRYSSAVNPSSFFFFFCTLMGGGAISRSVFFVSKDKEHWKTIFRMLSLAKQAVVLVQRGVIHCWKHSIFMDIVYKMSSSRNTLVPNVVQELLLVATSRRLQHFAVGCKVVGSITNSISMKAECKTARVPYQALYACLRTPDGQT